MFEIFIIAILCFIGGVMLGLIVGLRVGDQSLKEQIKEFDHILLEDECYKVEKI